MYKLLLLLFTITLFVSCEDNSRDAENIITEYHFVIGSKVINERSGRIINADGGILVKDPQTNEIEKLKNSTLNILGTYTLEIENIATGDITIVDKSINKSVLTDDEGDWGAGIEIDNLRPGRRIVGIRDFDVVFSTEWLQYRFEKRFSYTDSAPVWDKVYGLTTMLYNLDTNFHKKNNCTQYEEKNKQVVKQCSSAIQLRSEITLTEIN